MPSLHISYPGDGGCQYHRLLCPARFCGPSLEKRGWTVNMGPGLPRGHDVTIFHGLPIDANALIDIGRIKHDKKTFVWSVDDDWLSIPDWNPANPGLAGMAVYQIMKGMADYVLTSTPALAATFADMGDRVLCAPNLMDLHGFREPPVMEDGDGKPYYALQPPKGPVRLVWSGGHTHSNDIGVLDDVLCRVLDKFGMEKVCVVFVGMQPPSKLTRKFTNRGLIHQPSVHFAGYQSMIRDVNPHIYLAPLATVPFNLSKSAIRVYEGWALCAAPVATDWGEYATIRTGLDGRVASDAEGWYSALDRLIRDHEYRMGLAMNGYVRVTQEHNWNNPACRLPWDKVFDVICPSAANATAD